MLYIEFDLVCFIIQAPYGLVVQLDPNGKPIRSLHDSTGVFRCVFVITRVVVGEVVTITSIAEHGKRLFLGGLHNSYVAVLDTEQALSVPAQ